MLAKDMHQILQLEFKKCIFSASEGKFPLRHPHFFNGHKSMMPNKGIKTRKVGGIANIYWKLIMVFSKMLAKGMSLIEF